MIKDIKRKDEKDNFTGIGVEKDQNDSILNRAEIKNGWLVRYTHRIKAKDRYITIYDLTYDGGKIKDGFVNKYNNKIGMSPYSCVEEQLIYKNGNQEITNTIKLFIQNVWLNVEYDEGGTIIGGEKVTGLTIIYPNTLKLNKSLTGYRKLTKDDFSEGNYDDDKSNYIYIDADNQIILNTLKNLKNEVKGFDYYEN